MATTETVSQVASPTTTAIFSQPEVKNYTISQDKFFVTVITNTTTSSDGTAIKIVDSVQATPTGNINWFFDCINNNTDCRISANSSVDSILCFNNDAIGEPLTADQGEFVGGRNHSCQWTLISLTPQSIPPNFDILGPYRFVPNAVPSLCATRNSTSGTLYLDSPGSSNENFQEWILSSL